MSWFLWNSGTQDMERRKDFQAMPKQLKNEQHLLTWKRYRQEALMVAFLGAMVFQEG